MMSPEDADDRAARKLVRFLCEQGGSHDFDTGSWTLLYGKLVQYGVDGEQEPDVDDECEETPETVSVNTDAVVHCDETIQSTTVQQFINKFPTLFNCFVDPLSRRTTVEVSRAEYFENGRGSLEWSIDQIQFCHTNKLRLEL